jgi:hypothetical protein
LAKGNTAGSPDIAAPFPIHAGLVMNQLATRKKILVDDPARLYGFEPTAL